MATQLKINTFINRATTRCREIATILLGSIDLGYQDAKSKEWSAKLYEGRHFIRLLQTESKGDLTAQEQDDYIDFMWKWLELSPVHQVTYANYQMPIRNEMVTVPAGAYALATALAAEITTRGQRDTYLLGLINGIDIPDLADAFPENFWDNLDGSNAAVFDDDPRLHEHDNLAVLDDLTADHITLLGEVEAHMNAIGQASSPHITTLERATWNAKISSSQLSTALSAYALTGHTHSLSDITGLVSILNALEDDIVSMASVDGDDGLTPDFQLTSEGVLEYRYDDADPWVPLGDLTGPDGAPFTIDARGIATDRLNSSFDGEDANFTFLDEDTGYIYWRKPSGGPATIPAGWSLPLKFTGEDGWSPVFGAVDFGSTRTLMQIIDWVGGTTADKPPTTSGGLPLYVGPSGFTNQSQFATNFKGPQGFGTGPIVRDVGTLLERDGHDAEAEGYVYMRNDVSPATIFIKLSDTAADWSEELPWQGEPGEDGGAGSGAGGITITSVDTSGAAIELDMEDLTQKMFLSSVVIDGNATITLANAALALDIRSWKLQVDAANRVLTFPANMIIVPGTAGAIGAANVWTSPSAGKYEFSATYDGVEDEWLLKIIGNY